MSAPTVTLSIPDLPDGTDTLTVALALAACGIYVGPSIRGKKNPGSILGERWQDKTSRDPKQITTWFAGTDHDLFIHCGRSELVTLDVDRPELVPGDWWRYLDTAPYQPTRPDTPGRGHYIFAMPPGRMIGNPVGPWGEVRGLNGVIMVFPSHHVDGGRYGPWLRTGVVPVLPDVIAKTMPDASAAEDAATDAQVDAFLAAHTTATRPEVLDGLKKALANKFAAKLSRHGSTVPVLAGAMKEARAGYYPAMAAYDAIRPMFLAEVAKLPASSHQNSARTGKTAANEFYGILAWAVGQANAADLDEVRARVDAQMPDNTSWMNNLSGNGQAGPAPVAAPPIPLDAALAVFKKWLHIDDPAPVLAVAAAVIANTTAGEPVWLLIVGPPSGGKTEILVTCLDLGCNVVSAAVITEAALLSGTAKRDRAQNATGGLLGQIRDFGILLAKDFTSVLSQNHDTAKAAMAALREVYDGRWDRPVGTDGGKVLRWKGKCGFIGGVTPSFDRYSIIVNTLGDRFLLLRMPEVNAAKQAQAALKAAQHEQAMRSELATAMRGLIAGADLSKVTADLTEDDCRRLVALAEYAARARTAVERDGYTRELQALPMAEGPARLVKEMRQLYGALAALGVAVDDRWSILTRIALDCAPAIRTRLLRVPIYAEDWLRTSDIAEAAGLVTKTAARHLDDLVLLGLAERRKQPQKKRAADGDDDVRSPHQWQASGWLLDHWPSK